MSPRVGSEAESGNAAVARDTDREETRPRLTLWPSTSPHAKTPTPVERIGKLTAAELAELSPPDERGIRSGAFSKRFGQEKLDWSALRTPTPIPPPPAAEPIAVPSAIQPFYGTLPEAPERAELHIADLSLELANPFIGSSLTPPAPPKRPWLKPLWITLGGCLLIAAGYAGAIYHMERQALAKWTAAEVAPTVAMIPDAPLQAAMLPSAPAPALVEQAAAERTGEAEHTATLETAAVEEAVAIAESDPSVAVANEAPAAAAATPATDSTAAAPSPRARRRAARAAVIPQESAKAVETKAEVAPVAAPEAPAVPAAAPARPELAPNPYVARPAPAPARPVAPVAAPGPVPQTLSRAQVQSGLESMRGQLQTCAAGAHGRMTANVTISGAGRVTHVTVEGAFAGTPQGSCMARALRGAQFPRFAGEQLRVVYPFAL